MFEQLDEPEKRPQVSTATSLGIAAAYLAGVFGGLLLFIVLADKPFGIQITTAIVYSYFIFWYVFFPTRGLLEKYSLRDPVVQQQVLRLLAIHLAFLTLIVVWQTVLFTVKSRLLNYWLTEHGKRWDTLYELVLIGSFAIVFWAQVLVSRRILSRSLRNGSDEPQSEWVPANASTREMEMHILP